MTPDDIRKKAEEYRNQIITSKVQINLGEGGIPLRTILENLILDIQRATREECAEIVESYDRPDYLRTVMQGKGTHELLQKTAGLVLSMTTTEIANAIREKK